MIIRVATILTFIALTLSKTYGQSYEPLDLAKKIFDKAGLTNIQSFVTGEYEGRPKGQDLPNGAKVRACLGFEKT